MFDVKFSMWPKRYTMITLSQIIITTTEAQKLFLSVKYLSVECNKSTVCSNPKHYFVNNLEYLQNLPINEVSVSNSAQTNTQTHIFPSQSLIWPDGKFVTSICLANEHAHTQFSGLLKGNLLQKHYIHIFIDVRKKLV